MSLRHRLPNWILTVRLLIRDSSERRMRETVRYGESHGIIRRSRPACDLGCWVGRGSRRRVADSEPRRRRRAQLTTRPTASAVGSRAAGARTRRLLRRRLQRPRGETSSWTGDEEMLLS